MWFIDPGEDGAFGSVNSAGSSVFLSQQHYASPQQFAFGPMATSAGGNGGLTFWAIEGSGSEVVQPALLTGGSTQMDTFPGAMDFLSILSPSAIANDGNSYYYVTNIGGESGTGVGEIPENISVSTVATTQVSPYINGYTGGSALFSLQNVAGIAIDQSGNAWVVNANNSNSTGAQPAGGTYLGNGVNAANVTEFVGLGAPVNPVFAQDVANQTYGTQP